MNVAWALISNAIVMFLVGVFMALIAVETPDEKLGNYAALTSFIIVIASIILAFIAPWTAL